MIHQCDWDQAFTVTMREILMKGTFVWRKVRSIIHNDYDLRGIMNVEYKGKRQEKKWLSLGGGRFFISSSKGRRNEKVVAFVALLGRGNEEIWATVEGK